MVTEKDVQEAIAYCEGKLDPKRDDALLLAACYTIRREMLGNRDELSRVPAYSYAAPPELPETYSRQSGETTVGDYGDSDFLRAVQGKNPAEMWKVVDNLMENLKMVNPRVYEGVMRKIR